MHKIFAKTLFLGKNVVFLPHCHSTNDLARQLTSEKKTKDGTVVWTDFQEKGRGQRGNVWNSEPGKNLLFTIFLRPENFKTSEQFRLNMLVSVALSDVLSKYIDHRVEVKWPNDIYVNDRKVAGILIETTSSSSWIEDVYIGIGLNVNQSYFPLPTATSMKLEVHREFDRTEVLEQILLTIEKYHDGLFLKDFLKTRYLESLRWLNQERKFLINDNIEKGTITGIGAFGKLQVRVNGSLCLFDLKEIQFLE